MDQSVIVGIVVICVGIIIGWANLKKDSRWHTEWIQSHVKELREKYREDAKREEEVSHVLEELRIVNTRLATLVDSHHETIRKHDEEIMRIREKLHELANIVNIRFNKPHQ